MSTNDMLNQPVFDKSSALDLIFGFLQIAQRRGAFSFPESAKIYDCIQHFNDFFQPAEENEGADDVANEVDEEDEVANEVANEGDEEDEVDEENVTIEENDDPPTFPVETLGNFEDDK